MKVRVIVSFNGNTLTDEVIRAVPSVWRMLSDILSWGGYPGYKAKDCTIDKEGYLCHATNDKTLIRLKAIP